MAIEYVEIQDANGTSRRIAADLNGSDYYQVTKIAFGADGTFTLVDSSNPVPVTIANASIAITAASLPLPSGAATAANQSTANTHLATLAGAVSGGAVVVSDGSGAISVDDGGGSLTVDGTVAVSGLVAVTGPLTDTQLRATAVPVSLSGTTATSDSTAQTRLGDLTEAAPASDTASSGLNGRLQRIAQRLTSLIALLPTSLGQKTAANSLAVTVASDQSALTVGGISKVIDATLTRPNDTTAYAADDEISSSTSAPTILTLANCARSTGGSGYIHGAVLVTSGVMATNLEVHLYDTSSTPNNDNAAFSPSDAESGTVVAVIPFNSYFGTPNNRIFVSSPILAPFTTSDSANLFARIVTRSAFTPIAQETFKLRLRVSQD